MNVGALMTTNLRACTPHDTLDAAAQIMWDTDCGVVPIIDEENHILGMVTDRDICIAAHTQNRRLQEIPIRSIALKPVVTVRPFDSPDTAEKLMALHQVRRLAVIGEQNRLVGILSLNDLARVASRDPRALELNGVIRTLAAISQPRTGARDVARS